MSYARLCNEIKVLDCRFESVLRSCTVITYNWYMVNHFTDCLQFSAILVRPSVNDCMVSLPVLCTLNLLLMYLPFDTSGMWMYKHLHGY